MKKFITPVVLAFLLMEISSNAANLYLIDNGNTNSTNKVWGTPSIAGFTNVYKVNLSTCNGGISVSLTQWFTDRNKITAPSYSVTQLTGSAGNVTFTNSDQIWITSGTYNVSTVWNILSGSGAVVPAGIYGGFIGTESDLAQRSKRTNAWDFINETTINGSGSTTGIITAVGDRNLTIDGITFTACTTVAAIASRGGMNVQNCKFTANTAGALTYYTTTASKNSSCSNSYFYNNSISGNSLNAACIYVNNGSSGGIYTINSCLFDSNSSSASTSGASAGVKFQGTGVTNSSFCVFKNNNASDGNSSSISLTTVNNNLSNCLIYGTALASKPALYLTNGNVANCTFVNNLGGGAYLNQTSLASNLKITNTVFWGSDGSATTGSGVISAISNCVGTITNCAYNGLSANFTSTPTGTIVLTTSSNLFTDPTNNVWTLKSGSTLIDTGTSTGAPAADIMEISRPQNSLYDIGAYESLGVYRSKVTGNWATAGSWELSFDNSNWSSATIAPNINVISTIIQPSHHITVAANATASAITVNAGGQLTLNNGYTLNAASLTIQADTAKAGTFVDSNTNGGLTLSGNASVQQWLSTGRNWYICSPVTSATSAVINPAGNSNKLYWYDEAHGSTLPWAQITTNDSTLRTMKGYIVNMGADGMLNFSGTLHTGEKSITVNRTTGQLKEGFHLIGNPYPPYVNWESAVKTNIGSSIWYRTKTKAGAYTFDTYNATSHEGTNTNGISAVTGLIPPMQTVWVRVADGQTSGSVTFNNGMRSHKTGGATALKIRADKDEVQQSVHLTVSNGINTDETILVFHPEASNELDAYDSEKMSNNNSAIPEIFTKTANRALVINGMSRIPTDSVTQLGFTTLTAGNFTISAPSIKNIPADTQLLLYDNNTGEQTNLMTDSYNFNSDITSNNVTRFSLLFKAPGVTTSITNAENERISVFVNAQNQLVILGKKGCNYAIYNAVGQLIENGAITSNSQTLNFKHSTGVYVVKVNQQSTRVVVK